MAEETTLIQLKEISKILQIEADLCREFAEVGLIRIEIRKDTRYIGQDEIPKLRQIARLYRDLGVNREGIEVILPMRERIVRLQRQLEELSRRVERYEREYIEKNIELPRKRGMFYES